VIRLEPRAPAPEQTHDDERGQHHPNDELTLWHATKLRLRYA
jgi:hypothetical protein